MQELREKVNALEMETREISLHTKAQTKILTRMSREQIEIKHLIGGSQKRITVLETDMSWIKKAGLFILGALGVSHWFKI